MRFLFALLLMLATTATAVAERRVALVLADDDYRLVRKLSNPVNDGEAMEAALKKLGFEVVLETNRDLRRMRRALDDFREDAKGADVALVYFSGHGVEISGDNRLLPVDADASSLDQLEKTSLPLEEVRDAVAGEIDQRHIGALGVLAKIVESAAHTPEIAVGFENDLEAKLLQRRFHRLAVIDGIGQRPDQPVVVIGDDQRHAPLRHGGGGRRQDQQ